MNCEHKNFNITDIHWRWDGHVNYETVDIFCPDCDKSWSTSFSARFREICENVEKINFGDSGKW